MFTPQVITALNGIAWWAVMIFVWVAGIELDIKKAWTHRFETGVTAGLALVAPLAFGCVAALTMMQFSNGWIGERGQIAGNTISALTGVTVAYLVHDPMLAAGLAVGLAIAAMSLARSLHPPGGGMALTAVIGGSSVAVSGFAFALVPVCLNSALLALLAWAFHKFSGHAYPRTAPPAPSGKPPSALIQARAEDVDAPIEQMGETFEINRSDLDRLLFLVELNAHKRDRATS